MKTTAKNLRFHTKELLETASRGEEVIITYRGRECARLVPFDRKSGKQAEDELFGIWRDYAHAEDVAGYVRQLRKGRKFK
jgi:prevent-host-death family protein